MGAAQLSNLSWIRPTMRLRYWSGLLAQLLSQQGEFTFRSGSFLQAVLLSSYISVSSARPLRSTIVTRFFATMDPSDSRPVPPDGYVFPPDVGCVAASAPPGLPVSSTNLSLRAVPNYPGKPGDVMLPLYSLTGGRLHPLWQAGRLSLCVTRPNRVHLHYGSQVRLTRLRQADYSAPRSLSYMLNG